MYSEHLAILLLVAANGLSHPGYIHPQGTQAERQAGTALGAGIAAGASSQATRLPRSLRVPSRKAPAGTLLAHGDNNPVSP
ncbi:MAG: hypothetical protein FD187_218 [bacterium]|nr:MAG: hypothetical protein FD142_1776 [bacterium]KAF0150372.1 MAG: hypothetical protein FD187_218 [bacterium]KAF0168929.1 MAG: hypothetical protein FD158_787 [bacterium]TXT18119.1 MAG: hypothetical protein FD132_2188 [bacterium]